MPHRRTLYTVTLLTPEGERVIHAASDQHLWDEALAQGIKLPALCHQGWCLTCAGRLEGKGEVDQSDSIGYFQQDHATAFVLLCTGKPQSDLTIRTHQAIEMRRHRLRNQLPAPYSVGLNP
ncbi:MAG TPA: 2Fe-2S iron-sulfur cluster-binding protein [Terriglobales bacterium]|nr:2Fe-2S iron-sulfur cluster-binding protein [Terriglobales bacterium]